MAGRQRRRPPGPTANRGRTVADCSRPLATTPRPKCRRVQRRPQRSEYPRAPTCWNFTRSPVRRSTALIATTHGPPELAARRRLVEGAAGGRIRHHDRLDAQAPYKSTVDQKLTRAVAQVSTNSAQPEPTIVRLRLTPCRAASLGELGPLSFDDVLDLLLPAPAQSRLRPQPSPHVRNDS